MQRAFVRKRCKPSISWSVNSSDFPAINLSNRFFGPKMVRSKVAIAFVIRSFVTLASPKASLKSSL